MILPPLRVIEPLLAMMFGGNTSMPVFASQTNCVGPYSPAARLPSRDRSVRKPSVTGKYCTPSA